jgi:stage V sporulation protein AC
MSNGDYRDYAEKHMPRSQVLRNMLRAFLVGGIICVIGQGLTDIFMTLGVDKETAGSTCSICLVFIGAMLTGLGMYDNVAKFAGAGTLVPITGFANSVVAPALEFKTEGYILGTAAKMFIISGPVIVYGISASVIYGILYVLLT